MKTVNIFKNLFFIYLQDNHIFTLIQIYNYEYNKNPPLTFIILAKIKSYQHETVFVTI